MSEYQSNIDIQGVAQKIRQADRIGIVTHSKPDGDAFGSVVAMAAALRGLGHQVWAWFVPPVPAIFDDLKGRSLVEVFNPSHALPELDLLIIVDTGAWSQVSPMREVLSGLMARTLIVDHHLAGDIPAAWRYVDSHAAACCEIVAEVIECFQSDIPGPTDLFSPVVCEALFAGIVSDTGWFRFSNTREQTHVLAAKLIGHGVDQAQMYLQLEQRARPEKLALQIRALESLQWHADRRIALMVLRSSDFFETGAFLEETERFVDMPQSVESVEVVVLITQTPPSRKHGQEPPPTDGGADGGVIRLSFRSKAGPHAVDVARLAAQFGGGGHARAAGAKVKDSVDRVIEKVAAAAIAAMGS